MWVVPYNWTMAVTLHWYRLYTDGGADGNGARGVQGASGWGVHVQEVQGTAAAWRTLFDEAGELAAGGEATPAVPAQPASASDAESVHLNQEGEVVCTNCGALAGTIWCVCAYTIEVRKMG